MAKENRVSCSNLYLRTDSSFVFIFFWREEMEYTSYGYQVIENYSLSIPS